jgi:cyclopropane-fatty-acyl-phospholipid synthase
MANQEDLDYTYTLIDKVFRLSFGETGDFSGAMYNGDFSLSLEEAQRRKHEYIADSLKIQKDSKVLDMGCGWGAFLKYIKERSAGGTGVTLSTGQVKACRKNGLDVYLMDCRTITPEIFGTFDAVTCIGAFEAFCSREEWQAGKQDEIYRKFFKVVYELLKAGGRFYIQTMIFGKKMIDDKDVDINAAKNSDAYICALMQEQFPGHWLPYSLDQIVEDAKPYLKLIDKSNGRLDYIETQNQWRRKFRAFGLRKYLFYLSLIPRYLTNKEFQRRVNPFEANANRICFEREILDHFRLVFEKTPI